MRIPIRLAVFGMTYYTANQVQNRVFPKMSWNYWKHGGQKNGNVYLANQDLISKFRIFEGGVAEADAKH